MAFKFAFKHRAEEAAESDGDAPDKRPRLVADAAPPSNVDEEVEVERKPRPSLLAQVNGSRGAAGQREWKQVDIRSALVAHAEAEGPPVKEEPARSPEEATEEECGGGGGGAPRRAEADAFDEVREAKGAPLRNLPEALQPYARFVRVEVSENGGASILHVYMPTWTMTMRERREFARACLVEALSEDAGGFAKYSISVFHNAMAALPNILHKIADEFPDTEVQREQLGSDLLAETVSIRKYVNDCELTYAAGTHRAGPMRPISLVGRLNEERGGFFRDALLDLEQDPFLSTCLPWGPISALHGQAAAESDDGPILWVRPGEQYVPVVDLRDGVGVVSQASGAPRQRRKAQAAGAALRGSRLDGGRERLVLDRTNCHADHAGLFPERHPIAAVGILQSVEAPLPVLIQRSRPRRGCAADAELGSGGISAPRPWVKDVVVFASRDMERLGEMLPLDFNEEPMDQCVDPQMWVGDARLNRLRREGIRYARLQLQTDDLYLIPRKVVHQFKTIGACASVTWHLRYAGYAEFVEWARARWPATSPQGAAAVGPS